MNRADKEERMQRIRYGLSGLAFVFLLVLLATAINRAGEDKQSPPPYNELATPEEPNEPLAEIGAAPGTATSTNETGGEEPAPSKP